MLTLPQNWPVGAPSGRLQYLFDMLPLFLIISLFYFSDTGISHLCKELWFLSVGLIDFFFFINNFIGYNLYHKKFNLNMFGG